MNRSILLKRKWLPIALIPMMSVAVLNGCSSDDDGGSSTDNGDNMVVGDTDGSGVPDAFETTDNTLDTTGNGIIDTYDAADDGSNDTNSNGVDDSFEVAITSGTDANADGVDDDALAALDGGTDGGDGGTDGGDGGTDGGDGGTDGGDGGTDGGDGGTDGGGGTDNGDGIGTGSLGEVGMDGGVGTVNFSWDGTNFSGTVSTNADAGATSAALYSGIAASKDPGSLLIQLSGSGPNFDYPIGLSADQSTPIANNFASGNLYVRVETATGSVNSFQLLPPSGAVLARYTDLTSSDTGVNSTGAAFFNYNTTTGDYAAYLNVNINVSDTDSNDNTVTLSAAHIHSGSASGPVIIPLTDTGSGTEFQSTGTMNSDQLDVIETNNGWFNVHLNDGSTPGASFLTGQIKP